MAGGDGRDSPPKPPLRGGTPRGSCWARGGDKVKIEAGGKGKARPRLPPGPAQPPPLRDGPRAGGIALPGAAPQVGPNSPAPFPHPLVDDKRGLVGNDRMSLPLGSPPQVVPIVLSSIPRIRQSRRESGHRQVGAPEHYRRVWVGQNSNIRINLDSSCRRVSRQFHRLRPCGIFPFPPSQDEMGSAEALLIIPQSDSH